MTVRHTRQSALTDAVLQLQVCTPRGRDTFFTGGFGTHSSWVIVVGRLQNAELSALEMVIPYLKMKKVFDQLSLSSW